MRDREETLRLLGDGFLWDGETVWFAWNDYGSVECAPLLPRSADEIRDAAKEFCCSYEAFLYFADDPASAFEDAVIDAILPVSHDIYDSPDRLLADFLSEKGIDDELVELAPADIPKNVMAEFELRFMDDIVTYDELLEELSDDGPESAIRELTPSDLFKTLEKAGSLPGHDELAERWPHVALELDRLGITRDGTVPACVMSHDEMSQAIHEAMDNVYGPGFYDLLSESRDMTASSEKLDADSARGEDVRDAPETSERG